VYCGGDCDRYSDKVSWGAAVYLFSILRFNPGP
jgi:hypothetical protein